MFNRISALVAVLAVALGILGASSATASAVVRKAEYNPAAALAGGKTCVAGVTKQKVVFTNRHAKRAVQFNLRRTNDAVAPFYTSFTVRPGHTATKWVSVPTASRVSLRVRTPQSRRPSSLMLSKVITSLPGCRVIVRDPQATLGGTTCIGKDSVVSIGLDNRRTTDVSVEYATTATQPGSTTTDVTTVAARSIKSTFVVARSGNNPVHIVVTDGKGGPVLLDRNVPARSC